MDAAAAAAAAGVGKRRGKGGKSGKGGKGSGKGCKSQFSNPKARKSCKADPGKAACIQGGGKKTSCKISPHKAACKGATGGSKKSCKSSKTKKVLTIGSIVLALLAALWVWGLIKAAGFVAANPQLLEAAAA